jgi:hypothetical protein
MKYLLILTLAVIWIGIANFNHSAWLIGWDSYSPNLHFASNLERNVFGVWQEERGLGLLDGMSHTAQLLHSLAIYLLSFVIPNNLTRYVFHLLMLWLGGVGCFVLITRLTKSQTAATIGGLFYMLNLATIQMFHLPLEVFSIHFAALPWLTHNILSYWQKPTNRSALQLLLVSFLASPQGYVPTVFGATVLFIGIILLSQFSLTKAYFQKTLTIGFILFVSNAFWIIPYGYSMAKNLSVISHAKINLISNESIRLSNKAYGDFASVITGKGLYLSFLDYDDQNYIVPLLGAWEKHASNPWIIAIGTVCWAIAMIGLVAAFFKPKRKLIPFSIMYVICFLLLGSAIPVISHFSELLNNNFPLFANAYRFVFTKFSILFVLCYSVLLAYGIDRCLHFFHFRTALVRWTTLFFASVCFVMVAWPAFQGDFFSRDLQLAIPAEYQQLAQFFQEQDGNQRIQLLPQTDFWGWTYTNWGFKGSGFIWQALPQASLDGAFLPWSVENETQYLETHQAIVSHNITAFDNLLEKYQTDWVVIDKNNKKEGSAINFAALDEMIASSSALTLEQQFGSIAVYENRKSDSNHFLFVPPTITKTQPLGSYLRNDNVFAKNNHYVEDKDGNQVPYQHLASERDLTGIAAEQKDDFTILSIRPGTANTFPGALALNIPTLQEGKAYSFPLAVTVENQTITTTLYYPYYFSTSGREFGNVPIATMSTKVTPQNSYLLKVGGTDIILSSDKSNQSASVMLSTNTVPTASLFSVTPEKDNPNVLIATPLKQQLALSKEPLINNVRSVEKSFSQIIPSQELIAHVKTSPTSVDFADSVITFNCDVLRRGTYTKTIVEHSVEYQASDYASLCDNYGFGELTHQTGYLIQLEGESVRGKNTQFYIRNWITDETDLEFAMPEGKFSTFFSLLDQPLLVGNGYSLNFNTGSFKHTESDSIITNATFYPVPVDLLTQINLTSEQASNPQTNEIAVQKVTHHNPSFYTAKLSNEQPALFALLQGYDNGWVALLKQPSFIATFMKPQLLTHRRFNNWANAWELPAGYHEVIIIYWPQLLSFGGYLLLIITFLFLFPLALGKQPFWRQKRLQKHTKNRLLGKHHT